MAVQYKHGDLVFGKVRGYPPWPARVDETLMPGLKVTPTKVPVFFFGTHEIGILAPKDVCFYSKYKKTLGVPQKRTGFNRGMYEIRHTPDLKLETKTDVECDPSLNNDGIPPNKKSRPDVDDGKSVKNKDTVDLAVPNKNGVSVPSSDSSSSNSDKSSSKEESGSSDSDEGSLDSSSDKSWNDESGRRKINAPRKSKSKSNGVVSQSIQPYSECKVKRPTNLLQTKTSTCVSKLNDLGGGICSPISIRDTTNSEHEIIQLEMNSRDVEKYLLKTDKNLTKMEPKGSKVEDGFKMNGNKKGGTEELSNGNILPKVASNCSSAGMAPKAHQQQLPKHQLEVGELMASADARLGDKMKTKIAQKEAEKELKKKEKYERKKREKCLLLRSEVKLRALDLKIKESLSVVKQDFVNCLDAMEKMDAMSVTPLMLKKNPDILVTLRKCCRFKKSDQIRSKAEYLYNKFKSMFLVGEDETFSLVFQRDTQCLKEMADRLGRDVSDMTEDTIPAGAASVKLSVGEAASMTAKSTTNEFPET